MSSEETARALLAGAFTERLEDQEGWSARLETAIGEALAAAEEKGRQAGLAAAAGLAEKYRRQNRAATDQPSFHAQGRSEAARAIEEAIRAAARREELE